MITYIFRKGGKYGVRGIEDYTTIDVEVKGSKCGSIHANGEYADFDIDEWHQLLEQNKGGTLTYRRIPPSYELFSQMGLYQRNLSNFEETPLLVNTQTPDQCLNCHTPNGTNPDQYVFHVRGEHGATAICTEGNIRLLRPHRCSIRRKTSASRYMIHPLMSSSTTARRTELFATRLS